MNIFIRPLQESDALISYKWRNDPDVWVLMGSRPDRQITQEIELEWIRHVLSDKTTKRFAICVAGPDEYIGNVQLTGISADEAEFHIFIGEKSYWGKGVSTQATGMILKYAFNELHLKRVSLTVNKENIAAIKSYEKNGFKTVSTCQFNIRMEVYAREYGEGIWGLTS
jgi:diamine N-acetyltransferase